MLTCGTVLSTDQTLWISVEHPSRIMCAHMRACARTLWGRASPPPKQQRSESEKTKSEKRWKNLAWSQHVSTLFSDFPQIGNRVSINILVTESASLSFASNRPDLQPHDRIDLTASLAETPESAPKPRNISKYSQEMFLREGWGRDEERRTGKLPA